VSGNRGGISDPAGLADPAALFLPSIRDSPFYSVMPRMRRARSNRHGFKAGTSAGLKNHADRHWARPALVPPYRQKA
jgi:hypothetical protein